MPSQKGMNDLRLALRTLLRAPGLSRATMVTQYVPRNSFSKPTIAIGKSTSACRSSGKWKSAGITPPIS